MKLSEAILLGSVGTEQGYGCDAIMPNGQATCALGAALFAEGVKLGDWVVGMQVVTQRWPWTLMITPFPEVLTKHGLFMGHDCIYSMIWRLNDIAKWTRPQIAAWVADLEQTYDPDPVPVAVPEPVHESVPVQ